jgi:L-lysine 2,3-aminomutase
MEMQWLLEAVPNYTAYPILEKQSHCLEKLFKLYVLFKRCRFDINHCYRCTKSRAHNKRANFNQKKIDKHVDYIEKKPKNT